MQSPCESWHLHVLKATCYKTTYKSYCCQFSSLGDIKDISCILFLVQNGFFTHIFEKKTAHFHAQLFTSQPQALLLLNTDEILTFLWYRLTFRELAVRQFSSFSAKEGHLQ